VLSAQRAGGDILAGALLGGVLGGVCALTGGALGAVAGNAIGATSLAGYVVSGAIQGAIAGAGTGLATGYAGGKGTAEQMLESMGRAAAWGASLGALLGLGSWGLFSPNAAGVSDNYLAVGGFGKYDFAAATAQGTGATVNAVDNSLGLANDAIEPLIRGPQLADLGDVSDFITTTHIAGDAAFVTGHGALLNIYIGWVPSAVVSSGGFADVVVASVALDQAGFSYADQLALLLKAAPYFIDLALTLYSEMDPNDFTSDQAWLNKAFGSAEAATV